MNFYFNTHDNEYTTKKKKDEMKKDDDDPNKIQLSIDVENEIGEPINNIEGTTTESNNSGIGLENITLTVPSDNDHSSAMFMSAKTMEGLDDDHFDEGHHSAAVMAARERGQSVQPRSPLSATRGSNQSLPSEKKSEDSREEESISSDSLFDSDLSEATDEEEEDEEKEKELETKAKKTRKVKKTYSYIDDAGQVHSYEMWEEEEYTDSEVEDANNEPSDVIDMVPNASTPITPKKEEVNPRKMKYSLHIPFTTFKFKMKINRLILEEVFDPISKWEMILTTLLATLLAW
eukprot:CAMPEP_0117419348 /NCGR_PEP_ID=MMETSP0758-20121206/932_1 /TAXON_ID=63605 /ORGANISM="Percolomonas cosmopolitus, Strain AE-1 (ATCC 50343)" /LENGTH=289 /DNA_ID=CAMNT_0005200367 /DNA_START=37 /DNA_END=903 /DNA_ORIENTATION=+